MSVFSDTLTRYIEHKNIKVFSLAKYCNLDRSTMYKILNGKRNPPSSEVFEKMTQFMHLTPIEYNFLKETLEITQVGPDTYYTRKSVENFICQFPDQPATDITGSSFSPDPVSEQCQTDCISLVSQQHIDYYVHQMILSESVHADGKIAMFIQPDYNNLFPCMILTSDAAILCSSDYQNGIFIKSPDVVQLLWNQFISYKEQCSLFFRPAPLTPENHKAVIDSMFDTFYDQNDLIGIQPEPCLTPFFTGNLLHEIFNYDLPQADAILAAAEQAFQMNMVKIQNEQFLIYSTREGLLQFAKTGLTDEIPEIFYHPLTVEQRIEILNGVRQCCETGVYRFLQKPLNHLPHNLHFCIRGTMGSMVFRNNTGQIIVLNIEETCLVSIFRDYLEHMNPASYCSTEKATELVDQIINDLQNNRI